MIWAIAAVFVAAVVSATVWAWCELAKLMQAIEEAWR